jgi:hypothetical protein
MISAEDGEELKVDLLGRHTRFGHRLTPEMARRLQLTTLRYKQIWRITKDQQGCHHLPPTSNKPWDIRQIKVTLSLDTMSMLLITTAI